MVRRLALLLLVLMLPFTAFAAEPVEGVDYQRIEGGTPFRSLKPGQVEVVEIFAYTCIHCAHFAPALDAWKAKLPTNVRFDYVPAAYEVDDALGRALFASEALNMVSRTHAATFRAIHDDGRLARNPTDGEIATFYETLGVKPKPFLAAMASPSIAARMQAAHDFAVRSKIEGTPTLIVNGQYRVAGDSAEAQLANARRIVDMLLSAKH
jgi:thiol:disulfide interchange protein DsbA